MLPLITSAQTTELFPRYTVVDVYPKPTGDKSLEQIINDYQKSAPANINGTVCMDYLVLPNGLIGETRIVSTSPADDENLEYEGRMFVTRLPMFSPGILNGEKVRTWMRTILKFGKVSDKATETKEGAIAAFDVTGDGKYTAERLRKTPSKKIEKEVQQVIEQMPEFPGGLRSLMEFLSLNVVYPAECYNNGIQGKVIVCFIVEKDGSLSDIHVEKSVHPELDKSAIMAVRAMPRWYPAKITGNKQVRVKFSVPISFKL